MEEAREVNRRVGDAASGVTPPPGVTWKSGPSEPALSEVEGAALRRLEI